MPIDLAPPPAARTSFQRLVERLRELPGAPDPRREGLGEFTLWAGHKMFAHLDEDGALVLRLPPERTEKLIAEGSGEPWGVKAGSPLKGYLSVSLDHRARWFALARESQSYMGSKALGKRGTSRKKTGR